MLRSIEMSPRANLSKVFQDTALEAVLRALFSLPENSDREKLRRDNQDENRATIRMRMRRRGDYEGRA